MESLFCNICGIEINERNYNLNKEAFLNENTIDSIKFCPICGAPIKYLSKERFVYKLQEKELNKEVFKILDHAVKLEVFNGDFYKRASELAKTKAVSKLFKALASIEYGHAMVHKNLAGIKEMPKLATINYDKYDNDSILLEMAEKREEHAVNYYNKYGKDINSKTLHIIFEALKNVEIDHIHIINEK
ncbi:ferritin-like domain-containing protein [Clostridium sporogenes]|uniref:ferritin-like domain-containing protein n=1 Tax=Clostridium sporogenes TaxID=1509 RepID=UPI001C0F70C5|nr:ferritin-like domain-containing protein [Clostridium sporogenes]MBU5298685.1 ferritin-like domain-containing protein [Clostridium sporogenes]